MNTFIFMMLVLVKLTTENEDNFNIDVLCDVRRIGVRIEFDIPFQGIVFSKGFHNDPDCRYIATGSGVKVEVFDIQIHKCGTRINEVNDTVQISNEIIVQHDPFVQTSLDSELALNCELTSDTKHVTTSINKLQEEKTSTDDSMDAWLDFKLESAESINHIFYVGDKLIAMIYVKHEGNYDVLIKNCEARNVENFSSTIKLLDESGCSIHPKLLTSFNISTATPDADANEVAVARMNAFRFTDSNFLSITCQIEICEVQCSDACSALPGESNIRLGMTKRSFTEYDNTNLHSTKDFMQFTMDALAARLKASRPPPNISGEKHSRFDGQSGMILGRSSILGELSSDTSSSNTFSKKGLTDNSNKILIVTRNLTVISHTDIEKVTGKTASMETQNICMSRIRVILLAIFISITIIFLLIACVSMVLYIKNETKRNKISSYLLYSYR